MTDDIDINERCPECGAMIILVGIRHRCVPRSKPITPPGRKQQTADEARAAVAKTKKPAKKPKPARRKGREVSK